MGKNKGSIVREGLIWSSKFTERFLDFRHHSWNIRLKCFRPCRPGIYSLGEIHMNKQSHWMDVISGSNITMNNLLQQPRERRL